MKKTLHEANNRIKSKIKGRSGFTLAEALIAMLILLMVTAVVAGAMPVARNAYYKVVDGANAQLLLSTTVTALRTELEAAKEIEVEKPAEGNAGTISYISAATGSRSEIRLDNGFVMLHEYADYADGVAERNLISDKISTDRLAFKYESAVCSGGMITFKNIDVTNKSGENVLAHLDEFVIKLLND